MGPLNSRRLLRVLIALMLGLVCRGGLAQDPAPPLTGHDFRAALAAPVTATWSDVPAKLLLERLGENQRTAFLLDCRIDPTTPIRLTIVDEPFEGAVTKISGLLDAGWSRVGNLIYLGPQDQSRWIRTVIAQRDAELTGPDSTIPEPRQFDLLRRQTLQWDDLTSPAEILEQIASRFQLRIDHPDRMRYDLWRGGTIPLATAPEAVTLVLLPMGLDFRWRDDGQAIELVPYADPPLQRKRYRPAPGKTAQATRQSWLDQWPHLGIDIDGSDLVVAGRDEDHELLQQGKLRTPAPSTNKGGPTPLRRRQFTLKAENVPIRAILAELEKTGITIEYDRAAFAEAGVDLRTLVSVEVQQADADAFLKDVLRPVPVTFTINDRTVTLQLRPQ